MATAQQADVEALSPRSTWSALSACTGQVAPKQSLISALEMNWRGLSGLWKSSCAVSASTTAGWGEIIMGRAWRNRGQSACTLHGHRAPGNHGSKTHPAAVGCGAVQDTPQRPPEGHAWFSAQRLQGQELW